MTTRHLHIVPPPAPSPFEAVVIARIGADVFVCVKGDWRIAREDTEAADMLRDWCEAVDIERGSSALRWPVFGRGVAPCR